MNIEFNIAWFSQLIEINSISAIFNVLIDCTNFPLKETSWDTPELSILYNSKII